MGVQRVTKPFPVPSTNADGSNLEYGEGWNGTGTFEGGWFPPIPWALIAAIDYEPPLTEVWSVVGYAVSLDLQAVTQGHVSAKLGQLYAFLLLEGGYSSNPNPAKVPLPGDATMGILLWDGATDPFPPAINGFGGVAQPQGQRMPLQGQLQLPSPIPTTTGAQLGVGLWFTPSLITAPTGTGALLLAAMNASYTLIYDDGGQPRPGWGQ